MRRGMEIQVGLTVMAALAVLILGVTWLKEFSLQRSVRVWTVEFPQAGGLGASDEVQVNGIRKGSVKSMELVGDRVIVKLSIDSEVELTSDTHVAIRNVGMMGEKVIAVDLRSTGVTLTDRDTLRGLFELGIPEVMAGAGPTVDAVSRLSIQLAAIADALSKQGDVAGTMQNIKAMSQELRLMAEENRKLVQQTMQGMAATSQTLQKATEGREERLASAIDDFSTSMDKMDRVAGRLDSLTLSLNRVGTRIDRGQGTLGKLVAQDSLHTDLRNSVTALRSLIDDIKKNPRDYFRFSIF